MMISIDKNKLLALCNATVNAEKKYHHFSEVNGGNGHHIFCNYPSDPPKMTWCNCGCTDLRYAKQIALELITEISKDKEQENEESERRGEE